MDGSRTDVEQQEAAFAAVRAGLAGGGRPVEFSTAAELAAILTRLPAGTPVRVAEQLRTVPDVYAGDADVLTAYVAELITLADDSTGAVDECGRPVARLLRAVELGAVLTTADTPVPADTVPYAPAARALDALHAADPVAVLAAHAEVLADVAGVLGGTDDASLHEWITDPALREQLHLEAERLRHTAARLTQLRERVAAHLATHQATRPATTDPQ